MTRKQIHVMTIGLLLANVMSGLDATIINTALPAIIADLHGISCMGLIVSVFLLGMSVSTLLWSKFGERMGNKKAFELAVVLFIVGSALEGLSPDILFFVCARLLMGIGAGGLGSIPYIIFGNVYENLHTRSIILGFVSAVYGAASITGPLVGGLIVDSFSWHWIFYINVPIGLLIIAIIHFSYKEKIESVDKKVDWLGSFLLVSGLTCILMGIQVIGNESEMLVIGLIVSGIILCFCLVQAEKKASDPVMPLHIFKDRLLVLDFALFAVIWGASIAFNTYIPLWAQGLLGLSALMGGLTQIPASVFDFAGSQLSASIRERWSFASAVNLGIFQCFVCVSVHRCGFWRVFGRSDLQRFADQGSVRLIQAGYGGCHVIQFFDQNFESNTDGIDLRRADERCLESWSRTIRRKNHASDDEQIERCEIF